MASIKEAVRHRGYDSIRNEGLLTHGVVNYTNSTFYFVFI